MKQQPAGNSQFLSGRKCVVTGSTRGIGLAIARTFAAEGAEVIIHGRRPSDAARQAVEQIRELGGQATTQFADISDRRLVDAFVDGCWTHGTVDVWVNNAGADVLTGDAAELSFEQKMTLLWQTDVMGTIRIARRVGGRMKQNKSGVILNIGWDQAELGMEGDAGQMFGTTKGAIMAFTRSLARSLAPEVRVNCLAPGWIRTEWGSKATSYWQARAQRESLLDRWGHPDDVAAAALYLASPAASFITGQTMAINGGFRGSQP